MKHALITSAAVSVAALAFSATAEARGLRADIQCPYGNGGIAWTPTSGNPLSVNTGVSGAYSSLFVPPAGQISSDDVGLSVTAASQYNTYQNTPPAAATCSGGDTGSGPLYPLAQVMDYTLGSGNSIGAAGDLEVEFNYNSGVTSGKASFSLGGVTFSATGLTQANDSDFLFSATGTFLGAISSDGSALLKALPTGWASSGGTTTVNAPEVDAGGAAAACTLLLASIAVLRGRRRL